MRCLDKMSVDDMSEYKMSVDDMSKYKMFADELCGDKVTCFQCSLRGKDNTQHC